MAAVGRTLLIVVVVVLGLGAALYFLGPKTASRSQTLDIERPEATVLARLSSTPVGATVVEGVTIAEAPTTEGDTVTAPVAFADDGTGRVTYTVTADGEGSNVNVKLEQDLGPNPMNRFAALTGGEVAPLIAGPASAAEADFNALPNATFAGLQYNIVDLTARPFFYVENCSDTSPESVSSIVGQAVVAIPPVMQANRLSVNGELMAVEPRVVSNQSCYQIGSPYSGRQPRALLIGKTGETPAGQALRVVYTGTEHGSPERCHEQAAAQSRRSGFLSSVAMPPGCRRDDPLQPGFGRQIGADGIAPGMGTTADPMRPTRQRWAHKRNRPALVSLLAMGRRTAARPTEP